ncbi:hypothetical protein [Paenibacillus medicaginis]|uniref:Uncharacterized protein n=1 Tax=Paenibacillus medicaginis TaxID=1470560 RepID=A0ABV5C9D0_9BACL
MQWSEVRSRYSAQWVLVEAIEASTQGNKRVLDQLNVIGSFDDNSKEALRSYIKLHRENKQREMYVVHTSHDQLDITVTQWTGVRALR